MAEKLAILGRKVGMTRVFTPDGTVQAVTVIQAGPCPIVQVKDVANDGYDAIQIAYEPAKEKHLTKAQQGHLAKAGKGLYRRLKEVRLEAPAEKALGDELTVDMFAAGDLVKISGTSIGKGFQGVMKRWNFAGSKDTHGCEKVHRNAGGIGANTFPGKVWKNKKMAGHMGAEKVTVSNIMIYDVLPEDNVILVKGPVPGPKDGLVTVRKQ